MPNGQAVDDVLQVPWNLVVPEVDVHLVGYGNRMPNDFTLEMLAVLQRCNRVFGLPPIHAPEFRIPEMTSLLPLYGITKRRTETYREMMETVLDAAASEPPVAFATYGSALVGTLVTHRILEEAPKRNLTTHVTNAVSFLDGIMADFNLEPFYGLEIWEATTMVRLGIEPDTMANLLIAQAPHFGVAEGIDPQDQTFRRSTTLPVLRDHLLRFYPIEHQVHHIWTGNGIAPLRAPDIETVALRDITKPARRHASTLLVPRLKPIKKVDFERPASIGRAHDSTPTS